MDDLINNLIKFDDNLTDEEKLIKNSIRNYTDKVLVPQMSDCYESATLSNNIAKELANLGLFGMTLPSEYGGSGASSIAYGLACQELERADSSVRSYVSVQSSLCMYPIYAYGNTEQKEKYLTAMSKGDVIGCFGLTEPNSGSDPASMKTTYKRTDDGWLLNGSKMWITNATIADIAIVWAKSADSSKVSDIRGFIVDLSLDGVKTNEIKHKLSLRASITGELSFDDVMLPMNALLPGTEKGLGAALGCLSQARYGIAWGAIGAAEFCFETALNYSLERKQFDRPLAANQLVQAELVECYSEICKSKLFNLNLAKLKDAGKLDYVLISMAKRNACRVARMVARKCRDILGANGITLDYHVIRHMSNLETVYTYEGTDNIHTLAIGRYITGINSF